jgi:hypothetical protein
MVCGGHKLLKIKRAGIYLFHLVSSSVLSNTYVERKG